MQAEPLQHKPAVLNIFLTDVHLRKAFTHLARASFKAFDKGFCHNLSPKLQWQAWESLHARAPSLWEVQAGTTTVLHLFLGSPYNPHPTFGAVVIGYDTRSTGRERVHLNAQNVVFLLLSSNLMPSNSQPVLAAVTVATSSWLHPLLPCLFFH